MQDINRKLSSCNYSLIGDVEILLYFIEGLKNVFIEQLSLACGGLAGGGGKSRTRTRSVGPSRHETGPTCRQDII